MNYVTEKPIVREFTKQGTAVLRDHNRYFVERDGENWKMVDPDDRFVPADELGKNFGLWQDTEVTQGHFWWKETIRPLNGLIEGDEVLPMGQVLRQRHDSRVPGSYYPNLAYQDYDRLVSQKTEMQISPDGATLKTEWSTLGRLCLHAHSVENNRYLIG